MHSKPRLAFLLFAATFAPFSAAASPQAQIENTFEELDRTDAKRRLDAYLSVSSDELRRAMTWVYYEESFEKMPRPNLALRLLYLLLRSRPVRAGETMPAALALAYNYNYSVAPDHVRLELERDIIAHYDLYRQILDWQKKKLPFAALDRLPVIAQVYWASRDRSVQEVRHIAEYRSQLVTIRQLRLLHEALAESKLVYGRNVEEVARGVQFFYRERLLKRAEVTRQLRTSAAGPLLSLFEARGRFAALDSVADATNLEALYQAAGLAPLSCYQGCSENCGAFNHEWHAVFDPALGVWVTTQRGRPWPEHPDREAPVDLEIFRPMWHHAFMEEGWQEHQILSEADRTPPAHLGGRLRRNSYHERTTSGEIRSLVLRGLPHAVVESLWTERVWKKGTLRLTGEHAAEQTDR